MAFADIYEVDEQIDGALSGARRARAEALLDLAEILIRHHVDFTGLPSTDDKFRIARQVSIDMVIEAVGPKVRGASSYSVQLDGAVESATYRDSAGTVTIVFTQAMRALFGGGLDVATKPKWSFGDCAS